MVNLDLDDLEVIKESLIYSTYHIENSQNQASYEQKRDNLNKVAAVREKISLMIKQAKK